MSDWEYDGGIFTRVIKSGTDISDFPGWRTGMSSHTGFEYVAAIRKVEAPSLGYEVYVTRGGVLFHMSEHDSFMHTEVNALSAILRSEYVHHFNEHPEKKRSPELARAEAILNELTEAVQIITEQKALRDEGISRATSPTLEELEKNVIDARKRAVHAILGIER